MISTDATAAEVGYEAGAQPLPKEFFEWQLSARQAAYQRVAKGELPTRFSAHLPVVVTLNPDSEFPAHAATKGTGFTPIDDQIDNYIALFEECLKRCEGRPWRDTLGERIAVVRQFYKHTEHIDFRRLGLLEIFQGQTFRNLERDPRITLHYTGDGPSYPSYQINALAEIVGPDDARFRFIYLARQLFERDRFHILQPEYPFGYLTWVQEVYDKSPFHGRAGKRVRSAEALPALELKEILIPLDNSRYSDYCMNLGLQLAGKYGSRLTGSHVYAAKLHDTRFEQMEAGLPPKYQEPQELQRQRRVHDSLITTGLELISDSYLDVLDERCKQAQVPFVGKRPEGKNYAALVDDINRERYDLVILGARGLGAVEIGRNARGGHENGTSEPLLGSVAERIARRSKSDLLVAKSEQLIGGHIVVGVDGSPHSFAAVRLAVSLAVATDACVEAVATFDPHFHTVAFRGLEGVLSEEAGQVFRFKEQEKLHDEIIDKGIAKIYQDHLETARRVAAQDGAQIETRLLEGKPFPAILEYVNETKPSLLAIGRLGVHADEGLDLGATAENLLRLAPCHVLLVSRIFDPTTGKQVLEALSEGMPWTKEALDRLEHVPPFARSFARKAIDDYAHERGCSEVTPEVMAEARAELGM
ncbi:MAG: universal stress protein [Anaerolineales bacterium]